MRRPSGSAIRCVGKGSLAEFSAAREDKLAHKPEYLTFEQAAVLEISRLTALLALDVARVEAGQSVLVVGASGGVGTFAVQIAVAMSAKVTGVCSTAKTDLVVSLGAERVIDHTVNDFADGAQKYDVVLDIGGMSRVSRPRHALTRKGTLVIVGGEGGQHLEPWPGSPVDGDRALSLRRSATHDGPQQGALRRTRTSRGARHGGKITSVIERSYSLPQVPDAVRHLEAGKVRGKVVITL